MSCADDEDITVSNTHFKFQHKALRLAGAYFAKTVDNVTAFHIQIGSLAAILPLAQVRREFIQDPESPDATLLDLVEDALNFVPRIRDGDSIPTELLSGAASWAVDDHHRERAKMHMTSVLAAWQGDSDLVVQDGPGLNTCVDDEETRAKVQSAAKDLAKRLEYGEDGAQRVISAVDQFADEIAYIVALTDRLQQVKDIQKKIKKISAKCRENHTFNQELLRMDALISAPIQKMSNQINQIYAQIAEIFNVLKKFDTMVKFVRTTRDALRREFLLWDSMIEQWRKLDLSDTEDFEPICKQLYRFLAQNYLQAQRWSAAV